MTSNRSLAKLHALIQEKCHQSDLRAHLDEFFFQCRVNNLSE